MHAWLLVQTRHAPPESPQEELARPVWQTSWLSQQPPQVLGPHWLMTVWGHPRSESATTANGIHAIFPTMRDPTRETLSDDS